MSNRLSEVEARIGSVKQLSAVVTAMRGIAAARSREAREYLDGIRVYAGTISTAIGAALALLPEEAPITATGEAIGGHAVIVLCAEQGFAGTFNERVLDAAEHLLAVDGGERRELFLAGDRGLMVAGERKLQVDWSAPMIAHPGQAADLANRIIEALYDRLDAGDITHVTVIYAAPVPSAPPRLVTRRLVPFDFHRFPRPARVTDQIITMPPMRLASKLAEEYVFAELCEAVMLSFAAENEARMRAMIAAKANVGDTLNHLVAFSRQLRQEEITNEIIELSGMPQDAGGPS